MHALKMHTRKMHAREIHAREVHAYGRTHAHEIYVHRIVAFSLGMKMSKGAKWQLGTWGALFHAVLEFPGQ